MPTVQSEQLQDLTASDILSPKLWEPQAKRPPLGIGITCTKGCGHLRPSPLNNRSRRPSFGMHT